MSLEQRFTSSIASFSYIQTFYADPAAVAGSSEMSLTSIDLFVKSKPTSPSISGTLEPGIVICICEVREDVPNLNKIHNASFVRLGYSSIDTSTPVNGILGPYGSSDIAKFTFDAPIKLTTGRTYGVVIVLEDPQYVLHQNRAGDIITGTSVVSTGSPSLGSFIPKLYRGSNSGVFTPINDTDLAIIVNISKYTANSATIELTNKSYEFFTTNTRTKNFLVGERVFQQTANATGTVNVRQGNTIVVGTGTNFSVAGVTANSFIVLTSNSDYTQVVKVASVANSTQLTLADIPKFSNTAAGYKVTPTGTLYTFDQLTNKLVLVDSTAANSTYRFGIGNTIIGDVSNASANLVSIDNFSVDSFLPQINITVPPTTRLSGTYNFVANTTGGFNFASANAQRIRLDGTNPVTSYDGFILSRSNEIANTSFTLYGPNRKSAVLTVTLNSEAPTATLYTSPTIDLNTIDIFVGNNAISNTYTSTDANSITFDTEVTNAGIALSRHISIKTNFAANRFAEDIRVFLLGYRPLGTEIKVYAKVLNSADPETFDDRLWTPLEIVSNRLTYSSLDNQDDLVEYEYGFSQFPESAITLTGIATTQAANNQIAITADPTSQLASNNLIKIYNPLLPNNYEVTVATAVNSSIITVATPITNNNVIGTGLRIDRLKYYNTAFNNALNDNIVRYYNSSMAAFDKYDSMQIKIVLLADNTYVIPKVEQVQVIGVSA